MNRSIDGCKFHNDILRIPDYVSVASDGVVHALKRTGESFEGNGITVALGGSRVSLSAPGMAVERVHLRWQGSFAPGTRMLGDHWERAYGEQEWRGVFPERVMPWYFLTHDGRHTHGYGVRTGAAAMCYWKADESGISLVLDVRSGGVGVMLGDRVLEAATIVTREGIDGESAFEAARAFCAAMCPTPRLPDHIVYGSNNWYYAYGTSSHQDILRDTEILVANAPEIANRPHMVIDAGWALKAEVTTDAGVACAGGRWDVGNRKFPDMPGLAGDISRMGARPGIWIRPLAVDDEFDKSLLLPNNRMRMPQYGAPTLDPSIPENIAKVEADTRRLADWGYTLVKHDFSTYDILGTWGFEMGSALTARGWSFADRARTTAEIINSLYAAIRRAAGDAVVIGCNTVSHLSAGVFELQRTGDDTSGQEWERTRKMGLNTLAFRMPQHRAFYECDADCVGLTKHVPWELNSQWLDVLSRSGTPLFVSAAPDALGTEQTAALKAAFARASQPQPPAEPLDWFYTICPRTWRFGEDIRTYDWYPEEGTGM